MAGVDQLELYNNALLLLGQRALSSVSEDREPRHRLDDVWNADAILYCLEIAQPTFARETNTLSSPTTSSDHDLDSVHALPADCLRVLNVYSDAKLDQKVNRYIIDSRNLACEYATIYLRFISSANETTYSNWDSSFARVVEAYLAKEVSLRISPDRYNDMAELFTQRASLVKELADGREPVSRPTASAFTLTSDYLNIYNDALVLLGEAPITSTTDDSDRRTKLDRVMVNGAEAYCVEVIKPVFAKTTAQLSSPTTSSAHDLDSVHTLPSGYLCMIEAYSDSKLDQPITRYIIEGNTLACEYATVYLRYVSSSSYTTSQWTPSFKRVLSAYLAREACLAIKPESYEALDKELQMRIGAAVEIEKGNEPKRRSSATTVTLTNAWRNIYNDALFIMGLDEITSNDDDSDRRTKLDRTLDAGLVEAVLEDTNWNFGLTSVKIDYDPSLEPDFGYIRVHAHPVDMVSLYGIFQDEYMHTPLKYYKDEGGYFFSDLDTIFVQYVDNEFLTNPNNWPVYFRRLIAARMAHDAAASIPSADEQRSKDEYKERLNSAMATDVMQAPPRILSSGNWTRARYRGGYRGRPGGY